MFQYTSDCDVNLNNVSIEQRLNESSLLRRRHCQINRWGCKLILYLDDLEVVMKARPPDFPPPQPAEASAIAAEDVAIAVDESTKQLEDQSG